ncbi:MAG: 3-keto-disaccharide hydrolase [Planctomycetota bacterium]
MRGDAWLVTTVVSLLTAIVVFVGRAPEDAAGAWVRAFDGETLAGWVTEGGRYDGDARWTVEDGAITGRQGEGGAGGLLYTARSYRNVEIDLETFVTWPFDSGVFLRMQPDARGAQVTLDVRPGGEVGGIYSDGWLYHHPAGASHWRRDAWNHLNVRCVGDPMHIVARLNGELLTDFRIPEGSGPFAEQGLVGLQVHGGGSDARTGLARFRNVRIRELPDEAGRYFVADEAGFLRLTAAGKRVGWRRLFNGVDLEGWEPAGAGRGYRVEDGVLAFLVEGDSPHLMTADDYRDFHLRLDFKISRRANSGLFLRSVRDGGNPAFSGCEIQILDDLHWEEDTGNRLRPWQFTGSLYGAVPAGRPSRLRPLGAWNTFEVVYRGSRLLTVLNGKILYDVDTTEVDADPPFADRAAEGFIGLQRHAPGGRVEGDAYAWFRNLFVRQLGEDGR